MSGKGTAISRYRSQRTSDPTGTFLKDDKCGNVEAAGVSKNNCIHKPEPILHVRKRFVIMILSQIRHFCLVCGSIFIIGFSRLRTLEFFVFRKMEMSETKNHPLCGWSQQCYTKNHLSVRIELFRLLC